MNLTNKVALVTGASRGIGRSTALSLAKQGANVVVNYSGNEQAAKDVVSEIEKHGVKAVAIRADVSNVQDVEKMFEEIQSTFGRLDILVNNAGITRDNLLIRMKEEDWDRVIDINLKGVFNCSKAAAKIMMKQRYGRIVNVTSVVGIMGNPGQVNYVAAKAGVIGITKTLAKELASRGVTVNAIAPGFIETDMTEVLNGGVKDTLLSQIPLGTLGQPEDIANTVLFLVSEGSRYITGQTIAIDGGMSM